MSDSIYLTCEELFDFDSIVGEFLKEFNGTKCYCNSCNFDDPLSDLDHDSIAEQIWAIKKDYAELLK